MHMGTFCHTISPIIELITWKPKVDSLPGVTQGVITWNLFYSAYHSANYYDLLKGFDFLLKGLARKINMEETITNLVITFLSFYSLWSAPSIQCSCSDSLTRRILIVCENFHSFLFYFTFLIAYQEKNPAFAFKICWIIWLHALA